jgi:hypothetical protein
MQPQQNPYGFLGDVPAKKSLFGNAPKKTVMIFVGGVVALLIVVIIILFSLFSGSDPAEASLRSTLQRQLEIVRITSTEQVANGTERDTKNFSANVLMTIQSDNVKLTGALSAAGIKFEEEQLASPSSATTTTKIENAVSAGTINETTVEILTAELEAYRAELAATYEQTSTEAVRGVLEAAFTNTDLLLKQLESVK